MYYTFSIVCCNRTRYLFEPHAYILYNQVLAMSVTKMGSLFFGMHPLLRPRDLEKAAKAAERETAAMTDTMVE
jgi:hypothetical protein